MNRLNVLYHNFGDVLMRMLQHGTLLLPDAEEEWSLKVTLSLDARMLRWNDAG
jgi:hypothetical protein